jgi:hypothetical protein
MEILNYFVRNPSAADTLEGIARWRLVDELIHKRVEETRAALDWLVKSGWLRVHTSSSAGQIFSLNIGRLAEAESLLAEPASVKSPRKSNTRRRAK